MLVLALDTSTPVLSAGVADLDGDTVTLLAERTLTDAFAHAEQLLPLLELALSDAHRSLSDAQAVVVGLGPGPFTGLRVGIVSAAALGDGLEVPVYGVPSHAALAAGISGEVLVVTDARRREVYVSVYRGGVVLAGPESVAPAALSDWLASHDVQPDGITGPGMTLVADELPISEVAALVSTSEGLVRTAAGDLASGTGPAPLTPLYLRRPDATEPSAVRKSVLGNSGQGR